MAGANVHLVTKEEYTSVGSVALGERLAEQLRSQVRLLCSGAVPGAVMTLCLQAGVCCRLGRACPCLPVCCSVEAEQRVSPRCPSYGPRLQHITAQSLFILFGEPFGCARPHQRA